jgi:hypothetical protein
VRRLDGRRSRPCSRSRRPRHATNAEPERAAALRQARAVALIVALIDSCAAQQALVRRDHAFALVRQVRSRPRGMTDAAARVMATPTEPTVTTVNEPIVPYTAIEPPMVTAERSAIVSPVGWSAIFAAATVAVGTWLVLHLIGIGVGLTAIDPTDASSLRRVGIGTGIWSLIAPIIALFSADSCRPARADDQHGGARSTARSWAPRRSRVRAAGA